MKKARKVNERAGNLFYFGHDFKHDDSLIL